MKGAAKRKREESKSPGNAAVPLPENNANADKKNDKRRSSCYDSKILSDEKGFNQVHGVNAPNLTGLL